MPEIFDDAELIYSYTRKQAIEDGVLIDISNNEFMPFKYPVAITSGLHSEMSEGLKWVPDPENEEKEILPGMTPRINDLLNIMAVLCSKLQKGPPDRVNFSFKCGGKRIDAWSLCGPGDTPDPVITIMLKGED